MANKADSFTKTIDIYRKSPQVQPFFDNAFGYAVFPTIGGQKFSFEPME